MSPFLKSHVFRALFAIPSWGRVLDAMPRAPYNTLSPSSSDQSSTIGGSVEESAKSQAPIATVVPLMLSIMSTILMIQLQSFHRLLLVFAVVPLALIGVVMALLPSGAPLGFVAILGVLALIGILIRNSVILIVQIEDLRKEGRPAWDAVMESPEHRMPPIMLSAAAASLVLIPIAPDFLGTHGLRDDGRHHRRHLRALSCCLLHLSLTAPWLISTIDRRARSAKALRRARNQTRRPISVSSRYSVPHRFRSLRR